MHPRRVVISGLGVIAPNGQGWPEFWQNSLQARSWVKAISRFDASQYSCRVAGQADDFKAKHHLPRKVIKQTDRCSHMALAACQMAVQDSGLELEKEEATRVGIVFSNLLGGMEFAEPELYKQWESGPRNVSAYQSIAWFYAATQGQWSIMNRIKGYAKTLVADRAGGLQALGWGAQVIRNGRADLVFAGGFEAPIVPFAYLCHQTSGMLSRRNEDPSRAYCPFDGEHSGLVLGEGAGILLLEEHQRAKKRRAPVYAELTGFAMNCDGQDAILPERCGRQLARCLQTALRGARLDPQKVDYICADGMATEAGDCSETTAIKAAFGEYARRLAVSAPKSMIGHCMAGAGAIDTLWTALMIKHGVALPTINLRSPAEGCDLDYVPGDARGLKLQNALVIGRGEGGINCAAVLSA